MINSIRAAAVTLPIVFGPPALSAALEWEPYTLTVTFDDGHEEEMPATSAATCQTAMEAVRKGRWLRGEVVRALDCRPGDNFAPRSNCIEHHGCDWSGGK